MIGLSVARKCLRAQRLLLCTRSARSQTRGQSWERRQDNLLIGCLFVSAAGSLCFGIKKFVPGNHNALRNDGRKDYDANAQHDVRIISRSDAPSNQETASYIPEWLKAIDENRAEWLKVIDEKSTGFIPDWSALGDRLRDVVIPRWVWDLPATIEKLQTELTLKPGSLADEIWQEAHDPGLHPEILLDATVRIGPNLCEEEKKFLEKRQIHTRKALAKYLGLYENDIDPRDVPVIAMCGSGGGLRALVAGSSSYLTTHEAGLFDCVTYTAGVSGSCWLQCLYYSSITSQRFDNLIQHLKDRIGVHIANPNPLLGLLTSAPTNKYLLCGAFEKYYAVEEPDFGLVDVYGLLLGARLLIQRSDLRVNTSDLKVSNQRQFVKDGLHPLPIYTAVRHEIPFESQEGETTQESIEKAKREAWFQWFEFTPFEFFCEEWESGIPSWAVGRNFNNGRTIWRENGLCLPELRTPLLMGIWGSAFCATLSHYYKEVRPLIQGLVGLSDLDLAITGRDEDLAKVHPIEPAQIPNFALGLGDSLPPSCPESVTSSPFISLMDAGMSNNLPIYPLLRPGRNVDIIITFDASADVRKDNWLEVADGYAKKRGIHGWPVGIGWPATDAAEATKKQLDTADGLDVSIQQTPKKSTPIPSTNSSSTKGEKVADLGPCTVWVGTTMASKTSPEGFTAAVPISRLDPKAMESVNASTAGVVVIYFPLIPHEKVEGVDPTTTDFMSTWNFIYKPEQIEKVVQLAKANFDEGAEMTKECVRAAYERKKRIRLEKERWEYQSELMSDF